MPEQRLEWEAFSMANADWVDDGVRVQNRSKNYYGPIITDYENKGIIHNDWYDIPRNETRIMLPLWQNSPVIPRWPAFNWDLGSAVTCLNGEGCAAFEAIESHKTKLSEAYNLPDMSVPEEVEETEGFVDWFSDFVPPGDDPAEPVSDIVVPIINNIDYVELEDADSPDHQAVGVTEAIFYWRDIIRQILPPGSNGVVLVFENPCNPTFTYRIDGPAVTYLGRGDLHETKFDDMALGSRLDNLESFSIRNSSYTGIPLDQEECPFTFKVYPSTVMEDDYVTSQPIVFTIAAASIFVFTSLIFILYDCMVERRQRKVLNTAVRSNAIVSSLFPSVVRDRIFPTEDESTSHDKRPNAFKAIGVTNPKNRLSAFLNEGSTSPGVDSVEGAPSYTSRPIAELFPECTVLFADIAGFTAWSSTRDPAQVFTLLETLYGAFDALAKRRGVFKVETIGDSYVAVCGLPEPRKNHAVVMMRFAGACRTKMNELTHRLEKYLGPDTGDLTLRFGLNSGPVTAGVLRGEKSRFQLFGDTVNTAARMESTGIPNRIQVSRKTADLLIAAGKGAWVTARKDLVEAKGKGEMQTYWVEPAAATRSVTSVTDTGNSENDTDHGGDDINFDFGPIPSAKMQRLIDWNVEAFEGLLKNVVAHHAAMGTENTKVPIKSSIANMEYPRDEVSEAINLPKFTTNVANRPDPQTIQLDPRAVQQLRDYISICAFSYRTNAFHNFEHASHVVMATKKLLMRVVSPDVSVRNRDAKKFAKEVASNLHKSTYGITSDPLAQFAIVFAALIHDVDHPGVSNGKLVAEQAAVAGMFKNKSVAEQNSLCMAWDLLMQPNYEELRNTLFANEADVKRFRQLVVNAVMATDIFDKDLKAMREGRWRKAFSEKADLDDPDRKATIVVDFAIQASDVAHTMQHWKIYQKWNRCLFREMYTAYKMGRSEKDPSEGWYEGELWFFDNYIIQLAQKLKECGVFGASCDEFLDCARDNRTEWENKGREIVAEMVEAAAQDFEKQSFMSSMRALVQV